MSASTSTGTSSTSGAPSRRAAEAAAIVHRDARANRGVRSQVVSADVRQRLLDIESSQAMVRAASDAVRSAGEARRVVIGSIRRRRRDQHRRADRAGAAARVRAGAHARAGRHAPRRSAARARAGAAAVSLTSAPIRAICGDRRARPDAPLRRFHRRRRPVVRGRSRARSSAFSAPTAPASRRRSGCCADCCKPTSGTALVGGIDVSRNPEGVKRASATCRRGSRSTRR